MHQERGVQTYHVTTVDYPLLRMPRWTVEGSSYPKLATGSAVCIFISGLGIPTAPLLNHSV